MLLLECERLLLRKIYIFHNSTHVQGDSSTQCGCSDVFREDGPEAVALNVYDQQKHQLAYLWFLLLRFWVELLVQVLQLVSEWLVQLASTDQ